MAKRKKTIPAILRPASEPKSPRKRSRPVPKPLLMRRKLVAERTARIVCTLNDLSKAEVKKVVEAASLILDI